MRSIQNTNRGVLAILGFSFVQMKTDKTEMLNKDKDKISFNGIWGFVLGFIILLGIMFVATKITYKPQQSGSDGAVVTPTRQLVSDDVMATPTSTQGSFSDSVSESAQVKDKSGWVEFKSTKDHFSVLAPKYPEYQEEEKALPLSDNSTITVKTPIYKFQSGLFGLFVITINKIPGSGDASWDQDFLIQSYESTKKTLEDALGAAEASSKLITFKNIPAITFSLTGKSNDYRIRGIFAMADTLAFSIMYNDIKESFSDADYDKFINSFALEP